MESAAVRKTDARGFTLLELIVVVFVIGLAAMLAAPSIARSTDALRVRAQIAAFSALMRHAREQAITSGRQHSVVVDPDARQLTVVAGDDDVKRRRAIPEGWTIEAIPPPNLTVRFEPQGSSSGADFRIAANAIVYHVKVDAITGRVRSIRE
jgi:general secretion pathway protein H